ncbi:MAG: hypothetical protein FWE24_04355 [Defluviitaleaceae bacterium]|nr:hypothetical protein [Defluviitaleaceae bacterium]
MENPNFRAKEAKFIFGGKTMINLYSNFSSLKKNCTFILVITLIFNILLSGFSLDLADAAHYTGNDASGSLYGLSETDSRYSEITEDTLESGNGEYVSPPYYGTENPEHFPEYPEYPPASSENPAHRESGHIVTITFAEDESDKNIFFVKSGAKFDLLEGVKAVDENDKPVDVFVLDDDGFDIHAVLPDNGFTIKYGAVHPISGEEFSRNRVVIVVQELQALSSIFVTNESELRSAIANNPMAEIIIGNDILITGSTITIPSGSDITIQGETFTITQNTANQRHFIVNNDGVLRLENVTLRGSFPSNTANHGGVTVNAGGHLIMEAGSVIENNRAASGGGVQVSGSNSTLIMNSSTACIRNNFATSSGGGIMANLDAIVIINDGKIENNIANSWGGGIRYHNGARVSIYNCTISSNTSHIGGGGVSGGAGTLNIHGGAIESNIVTGTGISDNSSFGGGGGVMIDSTSVFNMTGGTIANNSAPVDIGMGGGVFINNSARVIMSGGIISHNTANRGGGVFNANRFHMSGGAVSNNTANRGSGVFNTRTFDMSGGSIDNNTAEYGGGVYVNTTGTFNLSGSAAIGHNHAEGDISASTNSFTGGGGGVHINGGHFNMDGGQIHNNLSTSSPGIGGGGGVHLRGGAIFNMSDGIIGGSSQAYANRNNTAQNITAHGTGAGVFMHNSNFNMSGNAVIANNTTGNTQGGGGVSMNGSTFIMDGDARIENNGAGDGGGGVLIAGSTFIMNSGTIAYNNINSSGGGGSGVHILVNGRFIMNGGEIHNHTRARNNNNIPTRNGGGVRLSAPTSVFEMHGGRIHSNQVANHGGGVFIQNGTFTIYDGEITGNTAAYGGGIWTQNHNNLTTSNRVVFSDNIANEVLNIGLETGLQLFPNILWQSENSVPNTHLLNNYDVNIGDNPVADDEDNDNGNSSNNNNNNNNDNDNWNDNYGSNGNTVADGGTNSAPQPEQPTTTSPNDLIIIDDLPVPLVPFNEDNLIIIDDLDVPLIPFSQSPDPDDTGTLIITDLPVPLSAMPQTGLRDFNVIFALGLLLSVLIAAITLRSIRKLRRENRW